jgi:hypothetical protein
VRFAISLGGDAMWVITEALANCQVRPNLRGLEDLGGFE